MVKPQQKTEVAVDVVVKMIGLITFYGSQDAAAGVPFIRVERFMGGEG